MTRGVPVFDMTTTNKEQLYENTWYYHKDLNREFYTPFSAYKREITEIGDKTLAKDKVAYISSKGGELKFRKVEYIGSDMFMAQTNIPLQEAVELPAGTYRHEKEDYRIDLPERLQVVDTREDDYIDLGGPFAEIENEIKTFVDKKDFYKKKNLMYKRGILLYGPPGNGKTVFIRKVIEKIVPKDAITIMVRDDLPEPAFLDKIRHSLGDRLKVFIFEELAITAKREHLAESLLNFLDGCDSLDGSLILATTNYPEKLPGNIVDRPSRIDTVLEIGNPKEESRARLISYFIEREATEEELKMSDGMSIAAIKEVCLLSYIKDMSFKSAVKMNRERSKLVDRAFAKASSTVGFGSDY